MPICHNDNNNNNNNTNNIEACNQPPDAVENCSDDRTLPVIVVVAAVPGTGDPEVRKPILLPWP
jgi:hypothetical protein